MIMRIIDSRDHRTAEHNLRSALTEFFQIFQNQSIIHTSPLPVLFRIVNLVII